MINLTQKIVIRGFRPFFCKSNLFSSKCQTGMIENLFISNTIACFSSIKIDSTKSIIRYKFSTNKNKTTNTENKNSNNNTDKDNQQNNSSQQHQHESQKQKESKIDMDQQKLKKQQQRLRKIQQRERLEIQQRNEKINLTSGTFNPFTAYLKLNIKRILLLLCSVAGIFGVTMFTKIVGKYQIQQVVYTDNNGKQIKQPMQIYRNKNQLTESIIKKNKLSIISEQYQQKICQQIKNIFNNCYKKLQKSSISPSLLNKISAIQNRLGQNFGNPHKIQLVSSDQPVIVCLPNKNIIMSHSLARSPQFAQSQLEYLILLMQQLFNQGYHVRTLSLAQFFTFLDPNEISNEIKLRQIYARKYKRNQILHSIQILNVKLKGTNFTKTDQEIKQIFEKLKNMQEQLQKVAIKSCQQNIYSRLYKYYIFVKIQ